MTCVACQLFMHTCVWLLQQRVHPSHHPSSPPVPYPTPPPPLLSPCPLPPTLTPTAPANSPVYTHRTLTAGTARSCCAGVLLTRAAG
jgi:hypothetical protein